MKYDPKIHGDGLTVMVPVDVEPPDDSDILAFDSNGTPHRTNSVFFCSAEGILSCIGIKVYGWTFAPALPPKPEPVKSYAAYMANEDAFATSGDWDDMVTKTDAKNADRASALIHFVFDNLPTDEDRAAILALLSDGEG